MVLIMLGSRFIALKKHGVGVPVADLENAD